MIKKVLEINIFFKRLFKSSDKKFFIRETKFLSRYSIFILFFFVYGCGQNDKELEANYKDGLAFFSLNKKEEALQKFKKIYTNSPDYRDTRLLIGKILYYDLKFKEAGVYFVEAYHGNENNLDALQWVIKTDFVSKAKNDDILEKIRKYTERDSSNPEILYLKGRICERAGKIEEAIDSYNKVILNSDKIALAHLQLGMIYKNAKLNEVAGKHLQMAKFIGKKDPVIQKEVNLLQKQMIE